MPFTLEEYAHAALSWTHLALEQSTFEQNKSLPFELMYELAERNAKVVFDLTLLVFQ